MFCRNNGEDKTVYTTHTLMSKAGKVICPILYAYKCPICAATGDYAHTLKYCPMLPKGVMGTTTATTKISPAAAAMAPKLPKTATFPQHLSARAKCSMGPPHKATFPQNLQSNQRFKSAQSGGFHMNQEFQDSFETQCFEMFDKKKCSGELRIAAGESKTKHVKHALHQYRHLSC